MQRVGDILMGKTSPAPHPMARKFGDAMAQAPKGIYELEKERAQRYNQTRGDLDASEYDCPVCLNRGHVCHGASNGAGLRGASSAARLKRLKRPQTGSGA